MAPIELRRFRGAQSLRPITSRVEKLCGTAFVYEPPSLS
jgi:hypothetical protein